MCIASEIAVQSVDQLLLSVYIWTLEQGQYVESESNKMNDFITLVMIQSEKW